MITELDRLLPLAKAGTEGNFTLVKSAYIDAASLSLKNIAVKFTKVL